MVADLSVGLIGYGAAGQVFHGPLISAAPGLRLATVVQRSGDSARLRYPAAQVVADVDAMLADPAIDLVTIAAPNGAHADLARRALLAGKHVVVDKPFTVSSAEADGLIALAASQGRLLSVFQNRRWDGDFLTVRQLLAEGRLGRLAAYESRFDRFRSALRPGAWRERPDPGAGLLYDLGAHLIDQAVQLFGPPQALWAQVRTQRAGAQADDQFTVVLEYAGMAATLAASMLAREPGPRFALHGEAGSFVKHGLDPQEDALRAGATPGGPGWGGEPAERWGTLNTQLGGLHIRGQVETLAGSYQRYYENVAAAIRGEAELLVSAAQARDTVRLIELARQSSAEGRRIAL